MFGSASAGGSGLVRAQQVCKSLTHQILRGALEISDAEMDAINMEHHEFHRYWNDTISPQPPVRSGGS